MAIPDGRISTSDIFTTLRYDPALYTSRHNSMLSSEGEFRPTAWYMFQFHLDRLRAAANQFKCVQPSPSIDHLAALDGEIARRKPVEGDADNQAWRVRLILNPVGGITIDQLKPVASLSHSILYPDTLDPSSQPENALYELFLCPHPTTPSPLTRHKTAERDVYSAARIACNLPTTPTADPVEVLLWNPAGELMEGSLTSVYCRKDGGWVTPAAKCGGNEGTTRRWAIQKGICTEGIMMAEDLVEGELVCISNGVRGFIYGVVRMAFFDDARRSAAS